MAFKTFSDRKSTMSQTSDVLLLTPDLRVVEGHTPKVYRRMKRPDQAETETLKQRIAKLAAAVNAQAGEFEHEASDETLVYQPPAAANLPHAAPASRRELTDTTALFTQDEMWFRPARAGEVSDEFEAQLSDDVMMRHLEMAQGKQALIEDRARDGSNHSVPTPLALALVVPKPEVDDQALEKSPREAKQDVTAGPNKQLESGKETQSDNSDTASDVKTETRVETSRASQVEDGAAETASAEGEAAPEVAVPTGRAHHTSDAAPGNTSGSDPLVPLQGDAENAGIPGGEANSSEPTGNFPTHTSNGPFDQGGSLPMKDVQEILPRAEDPTRKDTLSKEGPIPDNQAAPDGIAMPVAIDEQASTVDDEVLRAVVAEIVREELQGALGERITRTVRKLVRREIANQRAIEKTAD